MRSYGHTIFGGLGSLSDRVAVAPYASASSSQWRCPTRDAARRVPRREGASQRGAAGERGFASLFRVLARCRRREISSPPVCRCRRSRFCAVIRRAIVRSPTNCALVASVCFYPPSRRRGAFSSSVVGDPRSSILVVSSSRPPFAPPKGRRPRVRARPWNRVDQDIFNPVTTNDRLDDY